MVFLIRMLIFILLIYAVYWCIKYFLHPQKKLATAIEQKKTLIMDDKGSVHRNLILAYKGVLFEGEKYMGATDQSFQIIQIHVGPSDNQKLVGLNKEDFKSIESIIQAQYPYAQISWRSPVKELLLNMEKP